MVTKQFSLCILRGFRWRQQHSSDVPNHRWPASAQQRHTGFLSPSPSEVSSFSPQKYNTCNCFPRGSWLIWSRIFFNVGYIISHTANRYTAIKCFRVAGSLDTKMDVSNLARVFGPTIVGHSVLNPDPMTILQDTKRQPKVDLNFFLMSYCITATPVAVIKPFRMFG